MEEIQLGALKLILVQVALPLMGFVEYISSPAESTASQKLVDGQETELIELWGLMLAIDHELAPALGELETSTLPA